MSALTACAPAHQKRALDFTTENCEPHHVIAGN